jgi:superoxide reductase
MKKNDFYKCKSCNGIFEAVFDKKTEEEPTELIQIEAKTQDSTIEKHVPYIEEVEDGYIVKVGQNEKHPMKPEHFIEMIEILVDDRELHRVYLKPGEEAEYVFRVPKGKKVEAREYCNIHGLWKS